MAVFRANTIEIRISYSHNVDSKISFTQQLYFSCSSACIGKRSSQPTSPDTNFQNTRKLRLTSKAAKSSKSALLIFLPKFWTQIVIIHLYSIVQFFSTNSLDNLSNKPYFLITFRAGTLSGEVIILYNLYAIRHSCPL